MPDGKPVREDPRHEQEQTESRAEAQWNHRGQDEGREEVREGADPEEQKESGAPVPKPPHVDMNCVIPSSTCGGYPADGDPLSRAAR